MQSTTTVSTPNSPQYANFGYRLLVWLIDSLILLFFHSLFLISYFIFSLGSAVALGESNEGLALGLVYLAGAILMAINITLQVGYQVYFLGKKGQTPGNMATNTKVIGVDQSPVSRKVAFKRVLLPIGLTLVLNIPILGIMICFIGALLDGLWMLWDPKKQTLHDKIAKTIVVKL